MSGKMKKLICALLTGTMLLSSAGMISFAADPDQADTDKAAVTATAAPTEAPAEQATEAPAEKATEAPKAPAVTEPIVTNTKYDNDAYYQKALALCQGLGIITGYEDGSVQPESNVTRAEMAAIILRALDHSTTSSYQNIFTDVNASHWAANTIQTASALGVINGFPGGTFVPDGSVTYEQVAKMIVCAMNYHEIADYYGGYPNGHLKVAADLSITKNAPGQAGVDAERGIVIKMVYNALLADYNEPDGSEYGKSKYKAERTLAEYAFDVKEGKGILTGTEITSITSKNYQKGQVGILVEDKTTNTSTEQTFTTVLTGLENLLASNITFYYEEEKGSDIRKLLAIAENTAKTETATISQDDLKNADDFTGFDDTSKEGAIKLHGKSAYKITANPTVIYNGAVLTLKNYEDAQAANTKKDDTRLYKNIVKDANGIVTSADPINFNEFLKPEVGTVKLVDNDTDGKYDTVFVDSYETMLVTSATTKKVIGKIKQKDTTINVDEDASDLTITTTINGIEAAPRNLKKNNVVSLKRSFDGETIEFVSTGESFTGSISSVSDEDEIEIIVGGETYTVDDNAADDVKVGVQAIFYTDAFGRVGYIEAQTSGQLQSGEKYGWIMSMYSSNDGEKTLVQIFNQEGKTIEASLAKNIDFWGMNDTASSSKSDAVVASLLTTGSGDKVSIKDSAFLASGSTPIRLIKYKMNAQNELTRIYCAVDFSKVSDETALRMNPNNLKGKAAVGGSINGYSVSDGILEFTIPEAAADMKLAGNYKIGEATSGAYVVRENGSSRSFIIGEFKNASANVVINFEASGDSAASISTLDNTNNGPSVMVVEKVASGKDSDDNDIYTVTGYTGGSQVSFTTNKNTNFYEGTFGSFGIWNDSTHHNFITGTAGSDEDKAASLWNAANDANYNKKITSLAGSDSNPKGLRKGDIIIYSADAKVILRYAHAMDAKFDADGNFVKTSIPAIGAESYGGSPSRIQYIFDRITDHALDDVAWVHLDGGYTSNITFDPSMAIDVIEIYRAGTEVSRVEISREVASISELEDGDYMFVNIVDKGSSFKSLMVYRFMD